MEIAIWAPHISFRYGKRKGFVMLLSLLSHERQKVPKMSAVTLQDERNPTHGKCILPIP